ncbi:hypothetical protein [Pedobacter alpinus]|uniref:Zinc-finger domain-containing protein n=1 Tax=Pedobacter alpinus TaxID=1590643 RepID=A0ABW5TPJ2_9SPHI
MKNLEEKIWDYIDGLATAEERLDLEVFLKENPLAQEKFDELNAVNLDFKYLKLDGPSMAFSANIMSEINPPLSEKARVDHRIIYAIGGLFFLAMAACFTVAILNTNWNLGTSEQNSSFLQNLSFNTSMASIIKNYPYLFYGFLIFDLAVLLKFVDSYFTRFKESY